VALLQELEEPGAAVVHSLSGSWLLLLTYPQVPAPALEYCPQVWQVFPVQALLQQTPSEQYPESQSVPKTQALPKGKDKRSPIPIEPTVSEKLIFVELENLLFITVTGPSWSAPPDQSVWFKTEFAVLVKY
jgi:hypothetical protein